MSESWRFVLNISSKKQQRIRKSGMKETKTDPGDHGRVGARGLQSEWKGEEAIGKIPDEMDGL